MFAYNPTANDNSGQILAGYKTKSAEIKAAGNEALAQGIMRGATSAIGGGLGAATGFNTAGMITDASGNQIPGLGDALDDVKANAIKYDTAAGMMDAYKQMGPQMGITAEQIDALGAKHKNNPDALLGSLTVMERVAANNMSMQRQQAQVDGYKDLYDYKSANAPVKPPTAPKFNTGEARAFAAQAKAQNLTDDQIKEGLRNTLGPWAESAVYGNPNAGNFWGQ